MNKETTPIYSEVIAPNLVDGAMCGIIIDTKCKQISAAWLNEPRQANLCLRAFRHDKF